MMQSSETKEAAGPVLLTARPTFDDVYDEHFAFVWRSARALGVPDHAVDDVAQEIFVTVHARLDDFEGRSSLRTWIYGIARNVVRAHRRAGRKHDRGSPNEGPVDPDSLFDPREKDPENRAARAQAARVLVALLDTLDDDKREVFVLAELEQLTVPEIADMLAEKPNTVYSRLRLAREAFAAATERHRARDTWRSK
jgi:RNA polymerase sigma-70 factor, ECF subfamily